MDAGALARVDSLIAAAVADSVTPGAALAIGRHGRLVRLRGYGRLDYPRSTAAAVGGVGAAGDGPRPREPVAAAIGESTAFAYPVTPGTIYDVASLTKVVGTTTALMLLVDEGRVDLDRPVVDYLPWWAGEDPARRRVSVRQLLLHRGGLPPFERFYFDIAGRAAYERAIAALPLQYVPGRATVYSDIGFMTLGFLVEAVSGRSLDAFLAERAWRPLGMDDTGFRPPAARAVRIAPTEVDTIFRHTHVHGVVHDENAYAMGGVAGHAGLFSTAYDLAVFAHTLLNGGVAPACVPASEPGLICPHPRAEDLRLVDEGTLHAFTRRWDETASRALGWDTPSGTSSAGDYFGPRAFGHTGFTGTSVWMDPDLDLFVVLLTNRVNPTRDNSRHVPLRRAVHDAAALSIVDQAVRVREDAGRPGADR